MAVNRRTPTVGYGLADALQNLSPRPIIARRAPLATDSAELGTMWVNELTNAYWILASITAGASAWVAQTANIANVAALNVTGAVGFTVDVTADSNLHGDVAVGGNIDIVGNFNVAGNATFGGDLDLISHNAITLGTDVNAARALYLHANGAPLETIELYSQGGTDPASIDIHSSVGGIVVEALGYIANNAVSLVADAGGVQIDAVLTSAINVVGAGEDITLNATGGSIALTATEAAAGAVTLMASNAAGTVAITGVGGVDVVATNTPINVTSGTGIISISDDGAATTINVGTGAAAKTTTLGSTNGASATTVQSGTANLLMTSTAAANLDAVTFSIDSTTASNITVTGAAQDLTLNSAGGSVLVRSTESAAQAIRLHANGGVAETIQLHSNQGTAVNSINLLSDLGGLTLTATGNATTDAINLEAPAGGLDINTGLQINIDSAEAAATAIAIHASDVAGGITVDAGTGGTVFTNTNGVFTVTTGTGQVTISGDAAATTLHIGNGGAVKTNVLGSVNGASITTVQSGTAGLVMTSTGAATLDAVSISADATTASNVTVTGAGQDLTLSSVLGSVLVSSTENAPNCITLHANGGVAETIQLHSDQGTALDSILLTSDVGGVALVSTGLVNQNAVSLTATAGGISLDAGLAIIADATGAVEINSSGAAISIANDADAFGVNIATAGVRPVLIGNAAAGTTVTLNSPADVGITLQNAIRIITGAGDPTGLVAAPIGSLWLRTDAASAITRLYINTDAGTTWVHIPASA
jgi:hypothetical protein